MSWYKEANQPSDDTKAAANAVIDFVYKNKDVKSFSREQNTFLIREMKKSKKSSIWWNRIFINAVKKNYDVRAWVKFMGLLNLYDRETLKEFHFGTESDKADWHKELEQYIADIVSISSNHNLRMAILGESDLDAMNFRIPKWGIYEAKNMIMSNPQFSEAFANIEAEKINYGWKRNDDLSEIFFKEAVRGNKLARSALVRQLSTNGNLGFIVGISEYGPYNKFSVGDGDISVFHQMMKQKWFSDALFKFFCSHNITNSDSITFALFETIINSKSKKMPECMKRPIEEYLSNLNADKGYGRYDAEEVTEETYAYGIGHSEHRPISMAPWYKDFYKKMKKSGRDFDEYLKEYLDEHAIGMTKFMRSKYGWRGFLIPRIKEVINLSKRNNLDSNKNLKT